MTPRSLLPALGLLAFAAAPVAAQQAESPAGLDWLIGTWKGGGMHGGRRSEASLEVRPAIGGQFVELRYRLEVRAPRPFTFEGRAFYRPRRGGGWEAHWFDSSGQVLPVSASLEGTGLTADWGAAGTQRGRTVYRLLPDRRLEISDSVVGEDGNGREFARQTFRKER